MASVDLKYMKDSGLHELCKQLCRKFIPNTYNRDGRELRYLLPVKNLYLTQSSAKGNFPFTNKLTKEEFDYEYVGEKERVEAVTKINQHIRDYNQQLEAEEKRLDKEIGVERRVGKLKVYPAYEYPVWSVNAQCEMPIFQDHWKKNNVWERTLIDIRDFSNEIVYKKLHVPETMEECVAQFNRMIFEYLEEVTKGKELTETNSLYYPMKEFNDYMMRNNSTDINLLKNDVKTVRIPTSVFDEVLVHNILGKSKTNPDSMPEYDGGSYNLIIDAQERMLTLETESGSKTVSFEEAGFSAVKGINRFLKLLTYYAMFQEEMLRLGKTGKPITEIETAQAWEQFVGSRYKNKNTLSTYHGKLKRALTKLLHLTSVNTEILEKHSTTIQTAEGTQKHTYYNINLNLTYKKMVATSYRETIRNNSVVDGRIVEAEQVYHALSDEKQFKEWRDLEDELGIEQ